jgi:hypothetical protein
MFVFMYHHHNHLDLSTIECSTEVTVSYWGTPSCNDGEPVGFNQLTQDVTRKRIFSLGTALKGPTSLMFVQPVIGSQVTLIQSQIITRFPAFAEEWWLCGRNSGDFPDFTSTRWRSRDIMQPLTQVLCTVMRLLRLHETWSNRMRKTRIM